MRWVIRNPKFAYNKRRHFDTYDEGEDGVEWEQWMVGQPEKSRAISRRSIGGL